MANRAELSPLPLTAHLEREEAWALALLLKRLTWDHVRSCAQDDGEARVMMDAIRHMQQSLADIGCAPR